MVLLVQMSQETLETDTQKQETGVQADEQMGSSDNSLCTGGRRGPPKSDAVCLNSLCGAGVWKGELGYL